MYQLIFYTLLTGILILSKDITSSKILAAYFYVR